MRRRHFGDSLTRIETLGMRLFIVGFVVVTLIVPATWRMLHGGLSHQPDAQQACVVGDTIDGIPVKAIIAAGEAGITTHPQDDMECKYVVRWSERGKRGTLDATCTVTNGTVGSGWTSVDVAPQGTPALLAPIPRHVPEVRGRGKS